MGKRKTSSAEKVSVGRLLAWNTRPIALGATTIITGYISMFCTDMLGIPAAVIGTLLMVSKIFDGITDLFAGWLIDNTNTKWGKGRPYEISIIGVWLCMYLLFATGVDWSMTMKCVWIFVMYTLIFSIFSTLLNAAENVYIIRAFGNSLAITKVASYGGIIISLGCMVVSISFPMLVGSMGSTPEGWRKIMAIYAVPLIIIGLIRFIFVKEIHVPENEGKEGRVKVKDILSVLKTNKYIWISAVAVVVPMVVTGMSAATYYFDNIVGDITKYSTIQALSMVSMVFLVVVPALSKKLMPMQLVMWSAVVGLVGNLINFFAGKSMSLLALGFVLAGIASMPGSYLRAPIIMQLADYNEAKGQKRMEASIGAAHNFMQKLGTAFGSFILGILLEAGGYVGGAATQSDGAVMSIRVAYGIVPAILMIIVIICGIAYSPLDKYTKEQNRLKEAEKNK